MGKKKQKWWLKTRSSIYLRRIHSSSLPSHTSSVWRKRTNPWTHRNPRDFGRNSRWTDVSLYLAFVRAYRCLYERRYGTILRASAGRVEIASGYLFCHCFWPACVVRQVPTVQSATWPRAAFRFAWTCWTLSSAFTAQSIINNWQDVAEPPHKLTATDS